MDASEAGRALVASRARGIRQCEVCGRDFEGTLQRRLCSSSCRVRASRKARRESNDSNSDLRYVRVSARGWSWSVQLERRGRGLSDDDLREFNRVMKTDIEKDFRLFLRRSERNHIT